MSPSELRFNQSEIGQFVIANQQNILMTDNKRTVGSMYRVTHNVKNLKLAVLTCRESFCVY